MLRDLPQIIIIVPCYNEARRLDRNAFEKALHEIPALRIIFVDDCSTDNTLEVLSSMQQSRVLLLKNERNLGKAESVRSGLARVPSEWDADYLGFWDADLATPLEALPYFIDFLRINATPNNALALFGCRLMRLGSQVTRSPLRHYFGRVFATAVATLLGLPVYDSQCGAKLFHASVVKRLIVKPFTSRWFFDVELLARLIEDHGRESVTKRVLEIPLPTWIDKEGSKLKLRDFLSVPLELLKIYRSYPRLRKRG